MSIEIVTKETLQDMRKVRNDCREYLTNNTEIISEDQQIEWYDTTPIPHNNLFVYRHPNGNIIGYGIIRELDGCYVVTGGVISEYRGQGHGENLFKELTAVTLQKYGRSCLDVYTDNTRAMKLYKKLGYVECSNKSDKILHMIYMESV